MALIALRTFPRNSHTLIAKSILQAELFDTEFEITRDLAETGYLR